MAEVNSELVAVDEIAVTKRISWAAVFGGTLIALATELLFAAFGLFIGFTMSGGGRRRNQRLVAGLVFRHGVCGVVFGGVGYGPDG